MKNRKGFTTIELVIVIAVIAILATVFVPTFSNLIGKANDSKALQEAKDAYTNYLIENSGAASEFMLYKSGDRFVALRRGVAVAVCESRNAAIKVLCDDPDTDADESLGISTVAVVTDGLFVCERNMWDIDGDGVLEILAIGNSFSVDALEYAYQIASDLGIEKIAIGNLYIGGCSLNTHANNAAGDLANYAYYYNDSGSWKTTNQYKISTALESRDWDFVSLQQCSNDSGVESTYNGDLTDLISYVQQRSNAKLVWHMTWAYQQDSTHSAFPTYGRDQMTMYNSIMSAVQNKIVTNSNIDLIVPNGTAVQNSRTSILGDTTTRDGYHMSYDYGRYLTGLMFIKTLTGLSIDDITYAPSNVDEMERKIAIDAVNKAAECPFAVTESAYTAEAFDLSQYDLLDMDWILHAYWNSSDAYANKLFTDAGNSNQFIASAQRLTREQLPVGTIIVVQEGWQYRPEGWGGTRPGEVKTQYAVVTDTWWGNYTLRAFNVSKIGKPALDDMTTEQMKEVLKIYVPKER